MADYKIARSTRRCARLDRPFLPGEWYWSVVSVQADELIRLDIAADAWTGPPEGSLAYWKNQMPVNAQRKLRLAPDAVLVDLLHQFDREPGRQRVRYLLALLLLRRRLARVVPGDNLAAGTLELELVADGTRTKVVPFDFTAAEAKQLEAEITELLFCEA